MASTASLSQASTICQCTTTPHRKRATSFRRVSGPRRLLWAPRRTPTWTTRRCTPSRRPAMLSPPCRATSDPPTTTISLPHRALFTRSHGHLTRTTTRWRPPAPSCRAHLLPGLPNPARVRRATGGAHTRWTATAERWHLLCRWPRAGTPSPPWRTSGSTEVWCAQHKHQFPVFPSSLLVPQWLFFPFLHLSGSPPSIYLSSHWFDSSSRAATDRSNRHRPGETLIKFKPTVWRRKPRSRF